MTKSELRKAYLQKRRLLSREDRRSESELIADRFFSVFDLSGVKVLHLFLSIEKLNEIDTEPIFSKLWRDFPYLETVVPRVDLESNEIASLKLTSQTALAVNQWQIPEPLSGVLVEPTLIDMVLTPGLCFDRSGHRVGYGKGFYDRFLRNGRPDCVKIGLSYFEPVEKIDDTHDGDIALDFVITPVEVFRF